MSEEDINNILSHSIEEYECLDTLNKELLTRLGITVQNLPPNVDSVLKESTKCQQICQINDLTTSKVRLWYALKKLDDSKHCVKMMKMKSQLKILENGINQDRKTCDRLEKVIEDVRTLCNKKEYSPEFIKTQIVQTRYDVESKRKLLEKYKKYDDPKLQPAAYKSSIAELEDLKLQVEKEAKNNERLKLLNSFKL